MNSVATMFNNEEIKSIRAVREIESINKLPFYYPQEEELRMELVYEAGRRILPWDTGKDTAILDSLPIVLVSGNPPLRNSSRNHLLSGRFPTKYRDR